MPLVLTIAKNATQHTQQMYLPHQLLIGVSLSVDFLRIVTTPDPMIYYPYWYFTFPWLFWFSLYNCLAKLRFAHRCYSKINEWSR